jgi:hypothetical protein
MIKQMVGHIIGRDTWLDALLTTTFAIYTRWWVYTSDRENSRNVHNHVRVCRKGLFLATHVDELEIVPNQTGDAINPGIERGCGRARVDERRGLALL